MKKITFKKPSKKQVVLIIGVALLLLASAWLFMDFRHAKKDINRLWIAVDTLPGGSQALSGNIEEDSYQNGDETLYGASYKIVRQYVEDIDVMDPDYSYKEDEDVTYIRKSVRVVEVEVTNNDDWAYTAYGNIGKVDNNGQIIRSNITVKEEQDKNLTVNKSYSLELAPGGKGIFYVYFEDDGKEISKLYDVDNSVEVSY